MKVIGWIFGIVALLGVAFIGFGFAISTPESTARYDKLRTIDQWCDQTISDSALGSERRMTRETCDALKSKISKQ